MQFLIDISEENLANDLSQIFISKPGINLHLSGNDFEFISWGDPISTDKFRQQLQYERSIDFIINNLYGHFYYIFLDRRKNEFLIGNSLFSILPLYYSFHDGRVILSENAFTLGRYTGRTGLSKRFVLESVLFNYPLFNHSAIDGIELLPSNSGMIIGRDRIKIIRHTAVEKLFYGNPSSWKRSAGRMTDIFLETVKKYLPNEHYYTALTGGFDGRALTAAGIYHKKSFTCYCFGTAESRDLILSYETASDAGISFYPVDLDDVYIKDYSLEAGKSFILNSSGVGTFTRAHYVFSSGLLAGKTRYLVTGNFGSEIFRAVHIPGVIISPGLYTVFSSHDPGDAYNELRKSAGMKYLNQSEFASEWADLERDLQSLPCFNVKYGSLSKNEQFYIFVFEELFRKYFGAEMVRQSGWIKKRTPFLDIDFLKELLATGFAGVYSDFFEENPVKRYKGQVLYAHIIRKACPPLGKLVTDKGYRPDDLLSVPGASRIVKSYWDKRIRGKKDNTYDPNGVKGAWHNNHSYYEDLRVNTNIFNSDNIRSDRYSALNEVKAKIYSLIFVDNYLNKL
jgi:asparagine synthase (glutamine-hydrolysing)